jgi:hypothetical protein
MRPAFWESSGLSIAWEQSVAFAKLQSARERLPAIVGAYGRHWRAQELARLEIGIGGGSPLFSREVVELVGSLPASTMVDLRHGKPLLRRLAARRLPPSIAWRAKNEPLSDWLISRWIACDQQLASLVTRIRVSKLLSELVDPAGVWAAAKFVRAGGPHWLAAAIVELGALAEWVTQIEGVAKP